MGTKFKEQWEWLGKPFRASPRLLALSMLAGCLSVQGAELTQVDRFKEFLENPPVIGRLLVDERFPRDRSGSNSHPYLLAKWQRNASFSRRFADEDEVSGPDKEDTLAWASGRFENSWWSVFGRPRQVKRWEDKGVASEHNKSNVVFGAVNSELTVVAKSMNFGIPELLPGSIRWNGISFAGTNSFNGNSVSGFLKTNELNQVTGVDLEVSLKPELPFFRGGTHKFELVYEYNKSARHPELPCKVSTMAFKPDGSRVVACVLTYHEIEISGLPLSKGEFDPMTVAYPWSQIFTYSGNAMTYRAPNGRIEKVRQRDDPIFPNRIVPKRTNSFL